MPPSSLSSSLPTLPLHFLFIYKLVHAERWFVDKDTIRNEYSVQSVLFKSESNKLGTHVMNCFDKNATLIAFKGRVTKKY